MNNIEHNVTTNLSTVLPGSMFQVNVDWLIKRATDDARVMGTYFKNDLLYVISASKTQYIRILEPVTLIENDGFYRDCYVMHNSIIGKLCVWEHYFDDLSLIRVSHS